MIFSKNSKTQITSENPEKPKVKSELVLKTKNV